MCVRVKHVLIMYRPLNRALFISDRPLVHQPHLPVDLSLVITAALLVTWLIPTQNGTCTPVFFLFFF